MLININDESYGKIIEKSESIPIVIYYYSESVIGNPLNLEIVEKKFGDRILLAKYQVTPHSNVKDLTTTPCIKMFKKKKEVGGFVGNIPEMGLIDWIEDKVDLDD